MDLYREEILEHWQNPLNFGEMKNADLVIEQVNPLCGDEVTFYFRFSISHPELDSGSKKIPKQVRNDEWQIANGQWRISEVSFTGSGCAISIASASILSENIKNKKISTLSKITGEDVLKLIGGPVAPARLKCAFLSLEVIRKIR
ncbi:MAG: iron-sulfur cluster assembly scaffold protein [Patescibacteria group bacterium]